MLKTCVQHTINLSMKHLKFTNFACVCIYIDGWMDGWMGGWVGGWMDGWMCIYIYNYTKYLYGDCQDIFGFCMGNMDI